MSRGVGNSKPRSLPGIDGQQAIVKSYKGNGWEIVKAGKKTWQIAIIHQICPSFLLPKFSSVQYTKEYLQHS